MFKFILVILLIFYGSEFYGQSNISGYTNIYDDSKEEQLVFLTQLDNETIHYEKNSKIIAVAPIDGEGFFNIDVNLSEKQDLYSISINNNSDLLIAQDFILSNNDSIFFQINNGSVTVFENTNQADKEWQKLKAFKGKLDTSKSSQKKYLKEIRNYHKDSLKILAVKLLSIKELDKNKLLEIDITLNTNYYANLLKELKLSDIKSDEYIFLENKLAIQSLLKTKKKYAISKWINIILTGLILSLFSYIFLSKRTKKTTAIENLSNQEVNIKNHILLGKSNKEIADELFISLSTVKTHITSIYNKLNVSNRKELFVKLKKQHGY